MARYVDRVMSLGEEQGQLECFFDACCELKTGLDVTPSKPPLLSSRSSQSSGGDSHDTEFNYSAIKCGHQTLG